MKYKVNVINQKLTEEGWINEFKYWLKGECACSANKITVFGDKRLSLTEMESIVENRN